MKDVKDYFKLTAYNLELGSSNYSSEEDKTVRLWRVNGWTTNGFWMIKTDLELPIIQKVRDLEDENKPVEKIIPELTDEFKTLEIKNELKMAISDSLAIKFSSEFFDIWLNVYYVTLFEKIGEEHGLEIRFKAKGEKNPVIAVIDNNGTEEIIGVVMPIINLE